MPAISSTLVRFPDSGPGEPASVLSVASEPGVGRNGCMNAVDTVVSEAMEVKAKGACGFAKGEFGVPREAGLEGV